MIFIVDSKDQEVVARKTRGEAARYLLQKIGGSCPPGADPVKVAQAAAGDRFAMLNLSAAFDSISESGDRAAQELAASMRDAVDQVYK